MGISQIFSSNAVKAVSNFVKAHPIATAAGVGTVGLIAYKAATSLFTADKFAIVLTLW